MKNKKTYTVLTVVIILLLLVIGILGITINNISKNSNANAPNYVEIPKVKTSIISSSDGEIHNINADFTVRLSDDYKDKVTSGILYDKVVETVSKLDYDKISKVDNVPYIIGEIKENLSSVVPEDKLENVYISNMTIDIPDSVLNAQNNSQSNTRLDNQYKGLFQNIK